MRVADCAPAVRLLGQVNSRIRSRPAKRVSILSPYATRGILPAYATRGPNMTAVLKIAGKLYLMQAAIGFAAGFFIPWLKIFHAAGY